MKTIRLVPIIIAPSSDLKQTDKEKQFGGIRDLLFHPLFIISDAMREILQKHQGQMIGINLDKVTDYRAAQMTAVADDYFTVWAPTRKIAYHFPFTHVLSVAESIGGAGFKYDRTNVSLTVTVYHQVVYSGMIGMSMPLG